MDSDATLGKPDPPGVDGKQVIFEYPVFPLNGKETRHESAKSILAGSEWGTGTGERWTSAGEPAL